MRTRYIKDSHKDEKVRFVRDVEKKMKGGEKNHSFYRIKGDPKTLHETIIKQPTLY